MASLDFDASDLLRKAASLPRFLRAATSVRLDRLGEHVVGHLRGGMYYQQKTGATNRATTWRYVDTLERKVVVATPWAKYLDQGTRPHGIAAKDGKALRFVSGGGGVLFRRFVRHPGTIGFFFSIHEREWLEKQLPLVVSNAVDEAISSAGLEAA